MPHLSTRGNGQQERWFKDYLQIKNAGTEFILPWAVDTFFRAINEIKKRFTSNELKTIVEAYRTVHPLPEQIRLSSLLTQVLQTCEKDGLHIHHGVVRSSLEAKLHQLDDTQATVLVLWASAYWTDPNASSVNLTAYTQTY